MLSSAILPCSSCSVGGSNLTVFGYGFASDTVVTIGNASCDIIDVDLNNLRCRVPAVSESVEYWMTTAYKYMDCDAYKH